MPYGAVAPAPSLDRKKEWMYRVTRLFGSRAWTVSARITPRGHSSQHAVFAARGNLKRSGSDRREPMFPNLRGRKERTWPCSFLVSGYCTVMIEFPDWPPKLAVTVAVPGATPVTIPVPLMVATLVSLELQLA